MSEESQPSAADVFVASQICLESGWPVTASRIAKTLGCRVDQVDQVLDADELLADAVATLRIHEFGLGPTTLQAKAAEWMQEADEIYADAVAELGRHRERQRNLRPPPSAAGHNRRVGRINPRRHGPHK